MSPSGIILVLTVLFCLTLIDGMPARNRGEGGGGRCKYRKGQWGECNAATSKRVRQDTLITETSAANCNTTRNLEKACKKKTCEYGDWTDYGACDQSNKQTKTRPILTGTEQECGKKAKKTKTCRAGGARNGGGRRGGGRRGGKGES